MARITDGLDMTIAVDWDVKPRTKPKKVSSMFLQTGLKIVYGIYDYEKVLSSMVTVLFWGILSYIFEF